MKIAKPLLLITTPVGLALGLYEGWRLAGGLVFLMAAMVGVFGIAMASIVRTIRREREAERQQDVRQPRAGRDPSESERPDRSPPARR